MSAIATTVLSVGRTLRSRQDSLIDYRKTAEKTNMKTKRLHPYRISKMEAAAALQILRGSGPIIDRLRSLLEIRTGKRGTHRIGQGFRNDIQQIIQAAD
jgi:hypothetical protein